MNQPPEPPSSRTVFPLEADRVVIRGFLSGRKIYINREATIHTHGGKLYTSDPRKGGSSIAWYDTAGALYASIPRTRDALPAMRVINAIMEITGQPDRLVTRERHDLNPTIAYFFDGSPVMLGEPFVLMGNLGVLAYRAALKPTIPDPLDPPDPPT